MMKNNYQLDLDGNKIDLPLVPVAPGVKIALLDTAGDVELSDLIVKLVIKQLQVRKMSVDPETVLLSAGKATTLAVLLAQALGLKKVILAEKEPKAYWQSEEIISAEVRSITAGKSEFFYLGGERLAALEGPVWIVDDVLSTGSSVKAFMSLVEQSEQAQLQGIITPLTEGESWREKAEFRAYPLIQVANLPVWKEE